MKLDMKEDTLETVITEGGFDTEINTKIVHEEIFIMIFSNLSESWY